MRLCPWSLALASSIPVLDLESVCPQKGCPWPWPRIFFVSLASSLVSSTPPLVGNNDNVKLKHCTSLNNPGAGAGAEQLSLISSGAGAMTGQRIAPEQKLEHLQNCTAPTPYSKLLGLIV